MMIIAIIEPITSPTIAPVLWPSSSSSSSLLSGDVVVGSVVVVVRSILLNDELAKGASSDFNSTMIT